MVGRDVPSRRLSNLSTINSRGAMGREVKVKGEGEQRWIDSKW